MEVINMEILIRRKEVYGNEVFYPVCENAKLLAEIAGTTTLTERVLRNIKKMGIEIVLEQIKLEVF